jgi:hypothetical protein
MNWNLKMPNFEFSFINSKCLAVISKAIPVLWLPMIAMAASPCPPRACDGTLEDCSRVAQWVLEAQVADAFIGPRTACEIGAKSKCHQVNQAPVLVLVNIRQLKGALNTGVNGTVVLREGTLCWQPHQSFEASQVGGKYLFFGFNAPFVSGQPLQWDEYFEYATSK